mgnify:CR=1 FL=1
MATKHRKKSCPNCGETIGECACMRNLCNECGKPVGNITFSVCDNCWDKLHPESEEKNDAKK